MDAWKGAWKKGHDSIVIRWQEDEKYRNSQQAHGWTEEFCRYLDHLTTIDISYTAPWHQRHGYESTITLVCNDDDDRQAGPMRARKDFRPTMEIFTSLRQELGRQNSFIPKNERVRQRPFDEALRAELESMSQIGKPSSSSSSWQQWWQHELQDSQWREHQDTRWRDHNWWEEWWLQNLSKSYVAATLQDYCTIVVFSKISRTDFSECCARDGWWRQNTSHAHFSQSCQCRALDRTFDLSHAHASGSRFDRSCVVPLRTSKVTHSQHVSSTTPRRAWPISIIVFHATSFCIGSTAIDCNQETPLCYSAEDCCLAIWLNQLLSHCSKGTTRLQSSRGDSLANELTSAYHVNLKYFIHKTRKKTNHFLFPAWRNESWILQTNRRWLPMWSIIMRKKIQKESITTLCHIKIHGFMLNTTATWNDMKFFSIEDRRSCSMPNMLHISKTRRDMLYWWYHSTRHYWGGQEASRATNQQSIHHVRPWHSQVSTEE